MGVLLLTGTGLSIGGSISWLIERRPYLLSGSVPQKSARSFASFSFLFYLVVILTGSLFYLLSIWGLSTGEIVTYAFFLPLISAIAAFDFRYQLVPNRLIVTGIIGWCLLIAVGALPVLESLLAGLTAAFSILLVRWLGLWLYGKAGMGMGDVKLLFVMGLFLEWEVFWALYLSILSGGLWSIAAMTLGKLSYRSHLPFAPFLLAGTLLAVFALPFERFVNIWF